MNWVRWVLVVICGCGGSATLRGQVDLVSVEVDRDHIGIGGMTRPGTWTGVLMTLENRSSQPQKVLCQWSYQDGDGDEVVSQRAVTLTPERVQQAWIYGVPPASTDDQSTWRIQVLDDRTNTHLDTIETPPGELVNRFANIIGITGSTRLGLGPYTTPETLHEVSYLLQDIDPADLPDRWYGVSLLQTLIWTPQGTDPSDPGISTQTHRAIRDWVQRGGHLVVILPIAGDTWFESPLANLLPGVRTALVEEVDPPSWLGQPAGPGGIKIDYRVFDPIDDDVSVLLYDHPGTMTPVVVAGRSGFGRVTLIGIDLTNPALVRAGLPNGRELWKAVFGWQSPAYSQSELTALTETQKIVRPDLRRYLNPDQFIPRSIAMYGTAAPALLSAMVLFTLYWLTAGPIGFSVLKKRGLVRHSWMLFLASVVVFSTIAWGGATLLRPRGISGDHFTVLDIDGETGLIHARMWASLFVPHRGTMSVAIGDPSDTQPRHTLSSPGFGPSDDSGFIDPQRYTVDALSPRQVDIPFRATSKQIHVDYLDRLGRDPGTDDQPLADGWDVPQGRVRRGDGRLNLEGTLTHDFPEPLRNVLLVYCPGDREIPRVHRLDGSWQGGKPLHLDGIDLATKSQELVLPIQYDAKDKRLWIREGYLGQLFATQAGATWSGQNPARTELADDEIVQAIEILSFYNMLPPPDFRNLGLMGGTGNLGYRREIGRGLDMTSLLATRCLIVIGHIEQGPAAVPMTLDDQPIESSGWTVVRWVCPVD